MTAQNHKQEVIDKAKKLLALAEKGVDGEKETASRFLEKFLHKNGLTLDDLADSKIEDHQLKIKGRAIHRDLLQQIITSVSRDIKLFSTRNSKSIYVIECTKAEFLEIEMKYRIYSRSFDAELERVQNEFFVAFVHANGIFNPIKPEPNENEEVKEEMDYERRMRISSMIEGIEPSQVNPALEDK